MKFLLCVGCQNYELIGGVNEGKLRHCRYVKDCDGDNHFIKANDGRTI